MRDTVMTARDLAIMSAKENLASLDKRPGYAEAMKKPQLGWTASIVCAVVALGFAGLTYASWENIEATWLRWIVVLFFGGLSGLFLLLTLGASPKLDTNLHWGVAIVDKHQTDNKHELTIIKQDGTELRVPTTPELFNILRAGDVGIAIVADSAPHHITSFTRL